MNIKITVTVLILFIIAGCGSSREMVRPVTYSNNVGTGTSGDINIYVPQIFNRHNFEIYRSVSEDSEIYYESSWKMRILFDDELEMGIKDAKSRIIVRARPRGRDLPGSLNLFSINFLIENEVMREDMEWVNTVMTDQARSYFREMSLELRALLDTGFRNY